MDKEKELFKSLGIEVGMKDSLIRDTTPKEDIMKSEQTTPLTQHVRKGMAISAREILENSLVKGDAMMTDNTGLKNTHGEQFHSDNCKKVEKLQSNVEEVDREFGPETRPSHSKIKAQERKGQFFGKEHLSDGEGERPDTKSFSKEELFIKGTDEAIKEGTKVEAEEHGKGGSPKKIATDHVKQEGDEYYEELDEMEADLKAKKKGKAKKSENELDELCKAIHPMAPGAKAKKQPKPKSEARADRRRMRAAYPDVYKKSAAEACDSLIQMAADPFDPETIATVHENSPGVLEHHPEKEDDEKKS